MAEKTTVILEALMNVTDVESKIGRIQKGLKALNIPKDVAANLTDGLNKLGPLLKDYKKQLNNGFSTQKDVNNFNTLGKKIDEVFSDIDGEIQKINSKEIRLNVDLTDIKNTRAELARQGKDLENTINSTFNKIGDGLKKKNPNFDLNFLRQGPVAASLKPIGKELAEAFNTRDIDRYRAAYERLLKTISSMSASSKTKQNLAKQMGLDEKFINDAGKVNAKITELLNILRIPDTSFGAFEEGKAKLESTDQALNKLLQDAQSRGEGAFSGIANDINNTQKAMQGLTSETSSYGDSMATAAGQVRDLQQSTQYFFSLRNMLNLLKRGIDDAVQSVKELDAAMTETAVVTDYKVSDLWNMLPQYTQLANQLGATTQGAYETMTLYFQQGLDQQQAFEIGAETMKMARIAGLDYAETTDMMTAALRGFNMELNETSAKRINDVYSELAAITASDTEELGTAMQRTASIAHSAGMSFEGTTAFLAQAIETTREPAENIGTAMKTIVARFQEMKENPLEISEVDGEEVNYNKVDAALKSIGVSLKDTNGQFRELDQVFLDISSRWDSLSQTQQRYIATVAAGSRQQSRFIAMMDNYDRTVQLFEAANNSAGASDEQFGKTMDSLESKLNQLHNAWQRFTMGIANNSMIKLAVDGMTNVLTVTNSLINAFSLGIGPLKSFLSIFTAFAGLKVAGRAANSLIGGLGGLVDPQSTVKEGLKIGLFGQGKTNTQARAITTPIVGVLNKISQQVAQIKNKGVDNKGQSGQSGQSGSKVKNTSKQEYLDVRKQFEKLGGQEGFTIDEASSLFGKLDTKHQRSLFNNSPGTKRAMKKASMAWFDSKGLSKELTNEGKLYINSIYKGMQEGQIPVDKGAELIGQPQKWGQYFGTETALAYSKSFIQASEPAMKASTQKAHEYAMYGLGLNPEDYKVGSKELQSLLKDENNKQLKADYATLYKGWKEDFDKEGGHGGSKGKVSDLGRLANDIGSIGDKFTQAGDGITAFGDALSQLGGPIGTVGAGISAFGGAISSMGMMVSEATSLITVFSEGIEIAGTSIAISGGAIAAVAAPLAAAAAAFLLVRAHIKKVKEEGEKVTKTFNDINKETSDNISKLKSYQTEFATLSQGVDSNGNNVSLDDSQYQRYLEIVKDIAAINPDIIKGYNAQGHAIIDNNKALEETLKLEQQRQSKAQKEYTSKGSLQKLINARNVDDTFNTTRKGATGFRGDVFAIADQLSLIKDFDESSLHKYGVESLDALLNGEEEAVKNFTKHRDKIQNDLANAGIDFSDALIKGFDKLDEDQKAFDKAVQPVYDNLLANISNSSFYEELGSEFKNAIALGLKDIASQDLSASEMQSQANSLVQEFDNLTREGSRYATAMEQVESAQDKFAASLDASEYAKNTEGALNTLNSLLKEYEGNTTAYGQAVTEYLTNQIEKIKNFTEEGSISLTEALNGMTNTISAAEGAYDAFQESTKTDFSTGAQSMKSIFEEVTKETDGVMLHMEKFGDGTMWKGARALLGDEFVEKNGENVELVKKELLSLKDELQDGEKGFAAFWENFKKVDDSKIEGFTWNEDGSYDIDRDINPDAYKEIAEQMHRSEQYVVSMLNKGRQFADIDFTNVEDVRKALSTDTGAIAGTSTTDGNTDIFVKKDYLQNAMTEAGIVNPTEQTKETEKLLAKGIKIIPGPESITKKDFQHMGISDIPSLIQKFGDTGQFNRSEIEEYAQQMGNYNAGEFDTLYKDYLNSQEHPELPSINSIDNNVASIAGMLAHNLGIVSQEDRDNYHDANKLTYGEAGVMDSLPQLFSQGKNSKGENLSKDEFNATQKELKKQADSYDNTAKAYDALAKKATEEGNVKDAAWFTEAAKDYRKMSNDIGNYIDAGIKAYNDNVEAEKRKGDNRTNAEKAEDSKPASDKKKEKENKATEAAEEAREKRNKEYKNKYDSSGGPSGKSLEDQKADKDAENAAKAKHTAELQAQQAEQQSWQNQQELSNQRIALRKAENEEEAKRIAELQANQAKNADTTTLDTTATNIATTQEKYKALSGQFSNLFNDFAIRPELLKSAQGQQAIAQLYREAMSPNINAASENTLQALKTLGIGIDKAVEAGLVNYPYESATATATEAGAAVAKNTAEYTAQGAQKEAEKGLPEGIETVTPENIDEYNGGKNLAGAHNFISNLIKSILDGDWTSEGEAAASEASEKASSIWQKMWSGVKKVFNNSPESTSPSTSTTSESSAPSPSTVNKGTSAVANVAQNVVQTVTTQEQGVDETQKKLDAISSTASKGAKMKVEASQNGSLKTVQSQLDKIKGSAASGATIKVNSGKGDVIGKTQQKASKTAEMPLKIRDLATAKINQINANAKKPVSKTVNISPNYTGTWRKDVYIGKTGPGANKLYTGANNKISFHHVPQAGSLARGTKKGRVGPRNQGGLTLTGEKGYEIAWIPSESRSAILGASGPEMVNLPKEAVVYNHDQSKEIMKKRKGISAGSMDRGSYQPSGSVSTPVVKNYGQVSTQNDKRINKAVEDAQKVTVKIGKVSVWWENIARTTEGIQRKADAAYSDFQKFIKRMDATLTTTGTTGKGNEYITNLEKVIGNNRLQLNAATGELDSLASGKAGNKKTKIKFKKSNKSKKESKIKVKLADFIDYDDESGSYVINQTQLNKVAKSKKKGKNAAKAIKAKAEEKINDKLSKRNKAEDEIRKAQEALEKFGKELYENFFAWETELTKIWEITQRIADTEARINRTKEYSELLEAQVNSGMVAPDSDTFLKAFALEIQQDTQLLQQRAESLSEYQSDLQRLISTSDEEATLQSILNKINSGTLSPTEESGYREYFNQLSNKIVAQSTARSLTELTRLSDGTVQVNFNQEEFEKLKQNGQIGTEAAAEIQKWVKDITEASDKINDTYGEITSGLTDLYNKLDELQQQWVEYEKELLDGLEDSSKERTEELSKLSQSLDKALKKLLDEVKKKLDERRRQEENAKTERDISQKQQRLTMLQADTAGGHAVEIAQLQQEIDEARQNYQNSLEDQLLDRLQQQADQAMEQREQLIELSEAQIEATNNAALVAGWMADPINSKDMIINTYLKGKGYDKAGEAEQKKIMQQAESFWMGIVNNAKEQKAVHDSIKGLNTGTTKLANGEEVDGGLTGLITHTVNTSITKEEQKEQQKRNEEEQKKARDTAAATAAQQKAQNAANVYQSTLAAVRNKGDSYSYQDIATLQTAANQAGYQAGTYVRALIAGDGAPTWKHFLSTVKGKWDKERLASTFYADANFVKAFDKVYGKGAFNKAKGKGAPYPYKTGGIADFTGPAWLDGTPSKPELVLNATDTKNFIALKDVLSRAMSSVGHVENSYGGNANFEININVDHISNDYDVNKVVDQVEKRIVQKSGYRNVTQVRNFR